MLFHYDSKDFEVYFNWLVFFSMDYSSLWKVKDNSILNLLCFVTEQCIFQEESKESSGISHKLIGNTESHLKYENDRLKMALAQR